MPQSAAQVAGSIISYLRRYAYASVLGMYADQDTDGTASSGNGRPPAQQKSGNGKPQEAVLTYQDGSTVAIGNSAKAKAEQQKFTEYVKAHDGNAPKNIHNLRNWKPEKESA